MCARRAHHVTQVSISLEEGRHSSFTLAHHPYCMPAELRSLEVHLRGEKCNMGSFLYLDLRTTEQPNVGCTEQLFCVLPCLQQPCKFMLCIAKGHVSLSAMSWLIFHFQLQSISVILRQESGQMKTRTWPTKAYFLDLHYSNYNKATFFSYGRVLHKCMLLTQGPKKIFSCFFCLCIPMCAKRKYVWTLLCSLLRNYLKCEVSSFLLAIMIPYLKHSNYLLISLSSVVFLYFSFVLQSSCYENNNKSWMWTFCPFFNVKVFSFYWVRMLIDFWKYPCRKQAARILLWGFLKSWWNKKTKSFCE